MLTPDGEQQVSAPPLAIQSGRSHRSVNCHRDWRIVNSGPPIVKNLASG